MNKKLTEENRFLREQHVKDLKRIEEMSQGAQEMSKAVDLLIGAIVSRYGEQVYDDGQLIGARAEIPVPTSETGIVRMERYEKIINLKTNMMYRIGVIFPEDCG